VLTNRLSYLLKLVDSTVCFYEKEVNLGCMALAQEMIHMGHRDKEAGVMIKLDIEKAYGMNY